MILFFLKNLDFKELKMYYKNIPFSEFDMLWPVICGKIKMKY